MQIQIHTIAWLSCEDNGAIFGNIMYTRSKVVNYDGCECDTLIFRSVSVLPKYQRNDDGSALIHKALNVANEHRHLSYWFSVAKVITNVSDSSLVSRRNPSWGAWRWWASRLPYSLCDCGDTKQVKARYNFHVKLNITFDWYYDKCWFHRIISDFSWRIL